MIKLFHLFKALIKIPAFDKNKGAPGQLDETFKFISSTQKFFCTYYRFYYYCYGNYYCYHLLLKDSANEIILSVNN